MPKLSIIIPMYNSEKYIDKCLQSILDLRFQDYEVICIDDGSTDRTLYLCKEYQARDKRVSIISGRHKGVAGARNAGISKAKGEYIAFVDSDDYVENAMYEDLIKQLDFTKADMAVTDFYIDNGTEIKLRTNDSIVLSEFDGEQLIEYAFKREHYYGITAWLWNKVFRRAVMMQDQPLTFEEELEIGEDVVFLVEFALRTRKAIYLGNAFYHHIHRDSSLSKKYHPKNYNDRLSAYKMAINILEENHIPGENIIWLKRFYVYHAANFIESARKECDWGNEQLHKKDIRLYLDEYKQTNLDYPERIERIYRLLDQ